MGAAAQKIAKDGEDWSVACVLRGATIRLKQWRRFL